MSDHQSQSDAMLTQKLQLSVNGTNPRRDMWPCANRIGSEIWLSWTGMVVTFEVVHRSTRLFINTSRSSRSHWRPTDSFVNRFSHLNCSSPMHLQITSSMLDERCPFYRHMRWMVAKGPQGYIDCNLATLKQGPTPSTVQSASMMTAISTCEGFHLLCDSSISLVE